MWRNNLPNIVIYGLACAHVTVEGGAAYTYSWAYRILLQNRHRRTGLTDFKDDYRLWNCAKNRYRRTTLGYFKDDFLRRRTTFPDFKDDFKDDYRLWNRLRRTVFDDYRLWSKTINVIVEHPLKRFIDSIYEIALKFDF